MKIYFAGSIRGGREDAEIYTQLIESIQKYGQVLTEHLGLKSLTAFGETNLSDTEIYARDMEWLNQADAIIAEVTTPSLGVGYEVAKAEIMGKPILCLYREVSGKRVSAMLTGAPNLNVATYGNIDEANRIIEAFLSDLK